MKKFLILLSIFFLTSSIFSQIQFEFNYGDTLFDERIYNGYELDNNDKLFVGFIKENEDIIGNTNNGLILKLNKNGNLIKSIIYSKPDSAITIITIKKINSKLLIFSNIAPKNNIECQNILVTEIDNNLNVVKETMFNNPDTNCYGTTWFYVNVLKNGNLIFSGNKKSSNFNKFFPFITILNLENGTIVKHKIFKNFLSPASFFNIIEEKNLNKYIAYGMWLMQGSISQKLELDTNLNIINLDSFSYRIGNLINISWINDTSYLLTGIDHMAQNKQLNNDKYVDNSKQRWDLGLFLMNQYHEKINFYSFGKPGDTLDIPGMYKNIDYVNKNAIYYGGTCNFNMGYWSGEQRPFMLIKMDSNINVIWQKFYLTESCNELNSVLATRDGGCVLMGKKINFPATLNFDANVVIIKVDADGNFVGINEKENIQITAQEAIVYPNPCHDKINVRVGIHITTPAQLNIFNTNGQKVLSTVILNNFDEVSIAHLTAGAYFYKIMVENKIIGSGKLIKQ